MPKVPLTQAKRAAIKKPKLLRGTKLNFPSGVQVKYQQRLSALTAQMTAQTTRDLQRLFHARGPNAAAARIVTNALTDKFVDLFARHAKPAAQAMLDNALRASTTQLHGSLKELSGGLSLKTSAINPELRNVISASVTDNVNLIKSIPTEYLNDVKGAVMRSITHNGGLSELIPALKQYEMITHRRANMIAMDQTRKVYNNINASRMQTLGVKKFEWVHSGGSQKPRPLHQSMNGKIYSFDKLPVIDEDTQETGIPGQAINCRCTMIPVIEFEP
jgi:SPP1 gp7 family putative phage head morphogenesis protein